MVGVRGPRLLDFAEKEKKIANACFHISGRRKIAQLQKK